MAKKEEPEIRNAQGWTPAQEWNRKYQSLKPVVKKIITRILKRKNV